MRRGGNDAKAVIKRQRSESCASAPASVKNLRRLDVAPLLSTIDDGQVTAGENEVRIYPVAWKVSYLYAARPQFHMIDSAACAGSCCENLVIAINGALGRRGTDIYAGALGGEQGPVRDVRSIVRDQGLDFANAPLESTSNGGQNMLAWDEGHRCIDQISGIVVDLPSVRPLLHMIDTAAGTRTGCNDLGWGYEGDAPKRVIA